MVTIDDLMLEFYLNIGIGRNDNDVIREYTEKMKQLVGK